ncbi:PEP-CTERM sorting domain-containing protein [Massilia endophytica]|uniref:PEP-CTERM sorting domain-containing protein n=1 Tax=Massilia endophytica TaxID=2899220 RepID=UPI001E5F9AB0|nr:PEP-CTERM sorting domain-containing protein [Massilia endophytica]UGQ47404.1 PEP-CTERM sorting domain-containing protein [Massilia endophytica]
MRKLISICLASAFLTAGMAHAETRRFTYLGFETGPDRVFNGGASLSGSFTGEDVNHNGVIEAGELTDFRLGGFYNFTGCDGWSLTCEIKQFSFTQDGELSFNVERVQHDDMFPWYIEWESNGRYYLSSQRREWYWTPQTRLGVSAVPEPATLSMLGLGLGVLLMRGRRRN